MGKSTLFLLIIILAISVLVFLFTLTNLSDKTAERRNVVNGQIAEQSMQDWFEIPVDNKRPNQVPEDEKKAADHGMNFTIDLEKLKLDAGALQPLNSKTPSVPKLEPGKAGDELHGTMPDGLPRWFRTLDKDEDGQVALYEWRDSGKSFEEFRKFDLNGDGFITVQEMRRLVKSSNELKFDNGLSRIDGAIEATDEKYNGNKLSKIYTVKFDKGKTYQIDHISRAYDAFLYLEDPDGKVLAEDDDGGEGNDSRIVHEAALTGIYRVIVTSLSGNGRGPFSLSVRTVGGPGVLPKGVPPWFKDLDKNKDGQVSLLEWKESGKSADEFRRFDLNGNGYVTSAEVLQQMSRMPIDLTLKQNQAKSNSAIELTDQKYQEKKLSKTFTINLEKGRTYQIDVISPDFSAYLYLEELNGNILDKIHSGGKGLTARIVHTAATAGICRLIVTSQEGNRTGEFSISVRSNGPPAMNPLPVPIPRLHDKK